MPEPITAQAFIDRGVPADQAAALAADHNRNAGIRTDASTPAAPWQSRPAPPAQPAGISEQARAEIDSIKAKRANGEINDWAWRKQYEPRILELSGTAQPLKDFRAASGADKSVMLAQMEAGQTQEAFERSVDAAMEPAKSPSDYLTPPVPDDNPDGIRVDSELRQAMHGAGIPRDMGSALASEVEATAKVLASGNPAQIDAYMDEQEATLRRMFGAQYNARTQLASAFLQEQAAKNETLAALLRAKPELFESWQTVRMLAQVAESRRRRAGGTT